MWMGNGPGKFEQELGDLESRLGISTLDKAVRWAQTKSMWPDTFGLACCAIEMMSIVSAATTSRFGMEAFRASPRQADLLIVSGRRAQDGGAAPPDLRPDARAQVGDCDGRVRELGRDVQQLRLCKASTRSSPSTSTSPAAAASRGAHGRNPASARGSAGRRAACVRDQERRVVTWEQVPGHVGASERTARRRSSWSATRSWKRASTCATSTDSASSRTSRRRTTSAGAAGVSGYIGTATGRDLNTPMTQGYQRLPEPKPKRFAMNYHLLALRRGDGRILRVQVWLDDGESVPSVVGVWPTADWHEREAWDLMGIPIENHPNHRRILMDDDWEGHPLRKDYPIGGEPVRFSDAENAGTRACAHHEGHASHRRSLIPSRSRRTPRTSSRSTSARTIRRTACPACDRPARRDGQAARRDRLPAHRLREEHGAEDVVEGDHVPRADRLPVPEQRARLRARDREAAGASSART